MGHRHWPYHDETYKGATVLYVALVFETFYFYLWQNKNIFSWNVFSKFRKTDWLARNSRPHGVTWLTEKTSHFLIPTTTKVCTNNTTRDHIHDHMMSAVTICLFLYSHLSSPYSLSLQNGTILDRTYQTSQEDTTHENQLLWQGCRCLSGICRCQAVWIVSL